MRYSRLAALLVAASLSPAWALAADPAPATQTQQQAQNIAEFDKQMGGVSRNPRKFRQPSWIGPNPLSP
ncbi:hypothetical protein EFK07_30710 [Pseudomonas putida]|uniref:Uncharacterized protein n=1 Tax=Pseudomonas putida TaxID=303 RepID=A0A3M8S8Q0_PSEPU|nr:hypothetical protein EFK07_30710 [Pseudomonas putida]